METLKLKISGMGSAHCVGVVKNISETIIQEIEKMGYKIDR